MSILSQEEEQNNRYQTRWAHQYNASTIDQTITSFYLEDAGMMSQNAFIQDKEDIYNLISQTRSVSDAIDALSTFEIIEDNNNNHLEIGMFGTVSGMKFYYITAWTPDYKIAFQIIDEEDLSKRKVDRIEQRISKKEIDKARLEWERYSNKHQAQELVENVYSPDALYFNQGELYEGTTAIAERYAYMERPNWYISLTAEELYLVNDDLAYEIGRYKSNGEGIYILVWKRDEQGNWKVFFDFNF